MSDIGNPKAVSAVRRKMRIRKRIRMAVKYFFLILFCFFFLFPFFVMVTRSLMTNADVLHRNPVYILPTEIYWGNFVRAWDAQLVGYLLNTLIVEVCQVIGVPFTAALCAFGFSKVQFRFRETVFALVLSTMMLPGICTQIPLYVTYVKIGWINTLLPFTDTAFFGGGAVNIFLIREFMRGIPREMDEAAKIDGANAFMIFWRIVLPMCMPVIVLIMVQTFMGNWNDFMGPLLYLRDERVYTLAIGIYAWYSGASSADSYANVQMAVGIYMMLPCAVVFFIFQKQLIDGIQLGAVKG